MFHLSKSPIPHSRNKWMGRRIGEKMKKGEKKGKEEKGKRSANDPLDYIPFKGKKGGREKKRGERKSIRITTLHQKKKKEGGGREGRSGPKAYLLLPSEGKGKRKEEKGGGKR